MVITPESWIRCSSCLCHAAKVVFSPLIARWSSTNKNTCRPKAPPMRSMACASRSSCSIRSEYNTARKFRSARYSTMARARPRADSDSTTAPLLLSASTSRSTEWTSSGMSSDRRAGSKWCVTSSRNGPSTAQKGRPGSEAARKARTELRGSVCESRKTTGLGKCTVQRWNSGAAISGTTDASRRFQWSTAMRMAAA